MAAATSLKRSAVNFIVIKSTDQDTGKQSLASVALQDVIAAPDADALIAIKQALAPCLDKPIKHIEHTKVDIIEEA